MGFYEEIHKMRFSHKFIKIFISAFAAFFSFIGILTILDKIFSLEGKGFHGWNVYFIDFWVERLKDPKR